MGFCCNFANMRLKKLYTIAFFTFFTSIVMNAQNYIQCEDTCTHVHGIDLSHYQGDVFWETVGDNSKMAYVYLKATEAVIALTINTKAISNWLINTG